MWPANASALVLAAVAAAAWSVGAIQVSTGQGLINALRAGHDDIELVTDVVFGSAAPDVVEVAKNTTIRGRVGSGHAFHAFRLNFPWLGRSCWPFGAPACVLRPTCMVAWWFARALRPVARPAYLRLAPHILAAPCCADFTGDPKTTLRLLVREHVGALGTLAGPGPVHTRAIAMGAIASGPQCRRRWGAVAP